MNTTLAVKIKELSETEFFSFFVNHAFENNFSVALWRLPNDSAKHVILSQQYKTLAKDFQVEDLPTGFVFSPFDKEKEGLFLEADFLFSFVNEELKSPGSPLENSSLTWLSEQIKTFTPGAKPKYPPSIASSSEKADFIQLVARGLTEIEHGTFEKIVPSRIKTVDLPGEFDVAKTFQKLCKAYPNALVSFVSLPGVGTWLGASPELLVSVEDKTIFKTVALAGTKPYQDGINLKSVAWTQKEIEEQALVERYIISCFKKIRLREFDEHGPKTVVAGNVLHLKSEFTVDMKATNFPQLGSIMLQLLHPTSAVCGMPLNASLDFLKKNEGYDRKFYAGYLGPVNLNNNINIFVNLRCMQLVENQAILYSGAGVTSDSTPEEEWEETEMKLNTLLQLIQNHS